ncbi:MAG: IS66 family transposase [Thermoanaerobaculia bacterium]|nr:IS66 family transposase [Thermoanaerobaculia bacterium]
MELPNDITTCHRIILDLVSALEGIKPQLEGYIHQLEVYRGQIEVYRGQIEAQRGQIDQLELRVKDLESQINQNSRNSSRPPSTDWKKSKPAFPRGAGGKIGGKKGHDGGTLKMVSQVDDTVYHRLEVCSHCGKAHFQEPLNVHARRQVFDIPLPRIEVTEHQVLTWTCCGCQHENRGSFPADVTSATQYGPRLQTMSVLFNNAYCIPRNKIQQIFKDLYGVTLNEGTLQNQQQSAYEALAEDEAHIKSCLSQSPVVHFDETGVYVGSQRLWKHAISNERYTYLFVHPKRGMAAHEEDLSILPAFKNWAVHDCWTSYFHFLLCRHAVCGAHLLRELTALIEQGSKWAKEFHAFLLDLYQRSDKGRASIPTAQRARIRAQYKALLQKADKEEPPPIPKPRGKPKKTKGRNLLDRLTKYQKAVLAFAFHCAVPFTNNQAERDIRPAKTKMKVSGCFRTMQGAKIYARVQSFASTVRKLQFNPFNELFTVLTGGKPEYRLAGG